MRSRLSQLMLLAAAPRVDTLRWGSGVYLLVLGMSFLLLPQGPIGVWLDLIWLPGAGLLVAGLATLWLTVIPLPRRTALALSVVFALPPLAVTVAYLLLGVYAAATTVGLLTLGVIFAPLAPPARPGGRRRPDALALALGVIVVVQGADFLVVRPGPAASDGAAFGLPVTFFGAALIAGGVAVLAAQLIAATPRALLWLAHGCCGLAVLGLQVAIAVMIDPLYWVLGIAGTLRGLAILALPWWSERAGRLDRAAFRPRVALALVTAALVPVTIALPIVLGTIPASSAALPVAQQFAFGSSLIVILLAGLGGWWLAGSLAAPLGRLMTGVQQIARAQQAVELPPQHITELAALSAAVEQMARALEARAEERTALLAQAQEARAAAEEAVQVRDAFLSIAAHELRTPLTSLLGNAQLLQRRAGAAGNLAERDQRQLGVVVEQAGRLSQLINALLDVSRLETGQLQIERAPLDLGALARAVIEESAPLLGARRLITDIPAGPVLVAGDAMRLTQVLQNLIGNAVKYSPEGGPVTVALALEGAQARVAVSDTGIGIPAEALPNLFRQFFRAPNADSRGIGGIGVGLYVVHEIVTLHGGAVEVASAEGRGSTFTVSLPALKPDAVEAQVGYEQRAPQL